MKRLSTIMMCLLAMLAAGTGLMAQEVTIVLMPGYTWISIPTTDTLDFETALGSFTPAVGDMIKSRWGVATFRSDGQWRGSISEFYPGYGYHYYSNRTMPVFLTFNAQQPTPQLTVTTLEPTEITANSAVSGGSITSNDGSYVFVLEKGICWATHPNPMVMNDSYTENGSGAESFTAEMTGLNSGTVYYVRVFAVTADGTFYGEERSFITLSGGSMEYVDLGLPSGLLWATCNIGADTPEDYGDYFAWGEIHPKDIYNWSTYQYCNGSQNTLTKYCSKSNLGYNGFTDSLTILLHENDVATANWGANWRIPTKEEWQELLVNTTNTWTTQNGINGRLFTAANGNSIFLPAAGYYDGNSINYDGNGGYWSSLLYVNVPKNSWLCAFGSEAYASASYIDERCVGHTVRAVRSESQNNAPRGAIDGKYTINADGDQVYFSQGNLQYIGSASTPYRKFADNQWDYFGTTTGQNSSSQNVDRDLFGWGTSGYNHGANSYQPMSTSTSSSDYYAYGSYTYNLYDQTGQADWGYNPISNGGNQENQWRTLTDDEWGYLFYTRSTISGIRYAKARVNSVNGIILLPDDWEPNTYNLNYTNTGNASFSSNVITVSVWNTLEQGGAVFLPLAGYRNGNNWADSNGFYWSASYGDSQYSCNLAITADDIYCGGRAIFSRHNGLSVRLVAPAEN